MRDLPKNVTRAFQNLLDIDYYGSREQYKDKYRDICLDLAVWLQLSTAEMTPIDLENAIAPKWVQRFPELNWYYKRVQHHYKEQQERRKKYA